MCALCVYDYVLVDDDGREKKNLHNAHAMINPRTLGLVAKNHGTV